MRRLALFLVLSVVTASSSAGPALAVPLPDAEQAYTRGDYATAFKLWFPLAEAGSARAQENIARMYERGEWVAQDQATANEWYQRAADQRAQDAAMPVPAAVQQAQPAQQAPVQQAGVQAQQSSAPTRVSYTPPATPAPASSPVYYPAAAPYHPAPVHHHHHGGGRRH
jgi:TPR repeat protein